MRRALANDYKVRQYDDNAKSGNSAALPGEEGYSS